MTCSSRGLFHGVQSFRIRLLQPVGLRDLPSNLLQHRLLSPWIHRVCQEPAPVPASPLGIRLVLHGLLQKLQVDLHSPWNSMGYLTMVCTKGCREISAPAPGRIPHPPSSMGLMSSVLVLTYCHSFLLWLHCCLQVFLPRS